MDKKAFLGTIPRRPKKDCRRHVKLGQKHPLSIIYFLATITIVDIF